LVKEVAADVGLGEVVIGYAASQFVQRRHLYLRLTGLRRLGLRYGILGSRPVHLHRERSGWGSIFGLGVGWIPVILAGWSSYFLSY